MVANGRKKAMKWMRWIARGIGSLAAALWLFVGIVSGISEPGPPTLEGVILAGLIVTSALAVALAWWRGSIGGIVVIACGAAFSTFAYFTAGHNKGLAMLISGGPFLVAGILFLASWWRSRTSSLDHTLEV